jgi:hypothetical protein
MLLVRARPDLDCMAQTNEYKRSTPPGDEGGPSAGFQVSRQVLGSVSTYPGRQGLLQYCIYCKRFSVGRFKYRVLTCALLARFHR